MVTDLSDEVNTHIRCLVRILLCEVYLSIPVSWNVSTILQRVPRTRVGFSFFNSVFWVVFFLSPAPATKRSTWIFKRTCVINEKLSASINQTCQSNVILKADWINSMHLKTILIAKSEYLSTLSKLSIYHGC